MTTLRVLVTGGNGFVGAAIVQALHEKHPEWQLAVLDTKPTQPWQPAIASLHYIAVDVRDLGQVQLAVSDIRPDVIIHTAGLVPGGSSRYERADQDVVFQVNFNGTRNMLDIAKKCAVKAFAFTSSCTVITDDLDHEYPNMNESLPIPKTSLIYGESKAAAEKLVLQANNEAFRTIALRPSVILGEHDYQLIPSIHACIAKRETPWIIGDGDNLYDFTYVGNVADAHVLAVESLIDSSQAGGLAIFISNNQPVTFRDFCLAVWAVYGHTPPYQCHIPARVASLTGFLAECFTWLTGSPTTLCRGSIKDATRTRYADLTLARRILGYEPRVDIWDAVRISCEAHKATLACRKTS